MAPLRVLVTGPPGTGKTTLCERVRQELAPLAAQPSAPFQLEGFLCYERRDREGKGRRVGFDLVALETRPSGQEARWAPLARVDGPATGKMLGQYHVQVERFEALVLPILEHVDKGRGTRLLIFDEIGKMELFSSHFQTLIRRVLKSSDTGLHILGTVALKGPGLITESKSFKGVEVLEIDMGTRDAAQVDLTKRFAMALGVADGSAATPAAASSQLPPHPSLALPAASLGQLPSNEDFMFAEEPKGGQFTPVYPEDPPENIASLNAGDYLLYVGGSAINKAFAEALKGAGHEVKNRFELLHEALLEAAGRSPGKLCWIRPSSLFHEAPCNRRTDRCSYCKKRTDIWEAQWETWKGTPHCSDCWDHWADWAFEGLSAVCGLVPAAGDGSGAPEELLESLRPVGLVALSVFSSRKRPRRSEHNVAMLYTVGPNCGGVRKLRKREQDRLTPAGFLQVLEALGNAAASAISGYNRERGSTEDALGPLPRVDVLSVCLVSGGVYKHPGASKEDVARALLRGLARGHAAGGEHAPRCSFAWDEDVFRIAWEKMRAEEEGAR